MNHCCKSFNSSYFVTNTTRGIALRYVYNVASCPSPSLSYVLSYSNFSSWTTLSQNCVVTSVTCFSSFSITSSYVVKSSIVLLHSAALSSGVSGFTSAFNSSMSWLNVVITSPSFCAFISASMSSNISIAF